MTIEKDFHLPSYLRRFVSWIIDFFLLWIIYYTLLQISYGSPNYGSPSFLGILGVVLLYYVGKFLYNIICLIVFQATLGQIATNMQVASIDNSAGIPISTIMLRTLITIIPFEYLTMFTNKYKMSSHDIIAKTIVTTHKQTAITNQVETLPKPNWVLLSILGFMKILFLLFIAAILTGLGNIH